MKRSQTLWVGAVVGALVGFGVAYLIAPPPAEEERTVTVKGRPFLSKLGPAEAVGIVQALWALVRRVQRVAAKPDFA